MQVGKTQASPKHILGFGDLRSGADRKAVDRQADSIETEQGCGQ